MIKRSFLLILPLSLAACAAVGPEYVPPTIALTQSYVEGAPRPEGAAMREHWWLDYNDPRLNAFVERGLSQNLDIHAAVERINQAEAAVGRTGTPALINGPLTAQAVRSGGDDRPTNDNTSAGLGASVVLDLFGRERRSRERALAQLDAAELDVGTARLAFLSSLVGNYINARYYQEALAITRQNIANRQSTLNLVRQQREAGAATELDLVRAQALLDETRASLPGFETGFYSSVYAIATLLAEPAQPLINLLQQGAPQPRPRGGASVGVPADLLRNRPDVRAAERELAAAVAAVGVATAQLYPSIDLSGTVTASDSTTWSFGPALSLPVFNRPVLRASREQAVSQARQAELNWRDSVLEAVEDVQSAQSSYIRSQREVAAIRAALNSYERVVDLSRTTYEGGTTTLLDLLDSERLRGNARLSLANSIRDTANRWGELQVAAGRGWQ